MVMCIHGQEYDRCNFGCTLYEEKHWKKKYDTLKKSRDKLQASHKNLLYACEQLKKSVIQNRGNTVWDASYNFVEHALAEAEKIK